MATTSRDPTYLEILWFVSLFQTASTTFRLTEITDGLFRKNFQFTKGLETKVVLTPPGLVPQSIILIFIKYDLLTLKPVYRGFL